MAVFSDIKVKVKSEDQTSGVYEVAPLPRGYGHTLANSLRRILLSSIKGAGATSVTIKGIEHEYSTLPGVKEDVMEIILNLKSIRFKAASDEIQVCKLEVTGKKEVTAADIKVSGDVQIMTPDVHIASLTSADAKLSIEIAIETGVGYRAADDTDRSIQGKIPVATDFTPIKKVNFDVVSARKGQETDLDGVNIEIVTDGSIAPKEALLDAAKILQEFAGKVMVALGVSQAEVEERAEASTVIEEVAEVEAGVNEEVKGWRIEDLPISKRSKSGLLAGGYEVVADLMNLTSSDLLSLPGFGNKSLNEVIELMGQYGIEIK